MKKYFAAPELASKLREMGFNEPCLAFYNIRNTLVPEFHITEELLADIREEYKQAVNICLAPLYSQAFEFLKKKYNVEGFVISSHNEEKPYTFLLGKVNYGELMFVTPEEAQAEMLKELIQYIYESKCDSDSRSREQESTEPTI